MTWQPRSGVRIATVVIGWKGGTALAGRSLRAVEQQEDAALALAGAGWLAGIAALGIAVVVLGWLLGRDSGAQAPRRE